MDNPSLPSDLDNLSAPEETEEFVSLEEGLAKGLSSPKLESDARASIVAVGFPPSAIQRVLKLSAAISQRDIQEMPEDMVDLPPANHTLKILTKQQTAEKVLEDIRADMDAAHIAAEVSSTLRSHHGESKGIGGKEAEGPSAGIPPSEASADDLVAAPVTMRNATQSTVNRPVPDDGWVVDNMRAVPEPEPEQTMLGPAAENSRFPNYNAGELPLLFINGLTLALVPGDREAVFDSGEQSNWWISDLTTNSELTQTLRAQALSAWASSEPVRSHSPTRTIFLAAAEEHISQTYRNALREMLDQNPISIRKLRSGSGRRPPAPTVGIDEVLVIAAVVAEGCTRKDIETLVEALGLFSSRTLTRASDRLERANAVVAEPDPSHDSVGRPPHVYQVGPDVGPGLADTPAALAKRVGTLLYETAPDGSW